MKIWGFDTPCMLWHTTNETFVHSERHRQDGKNLFQPRIKCVLMMWERSSNLCFLKSNGAPTKARESLVHREEFLLVLYWTPKKWENHIYYLALRVCIWCIMTPISMPLCIYKFTSKPIKMFSVNMAWHFTWYIWKHFSKMPLYNS